MPSFEQSTNASIEHLNTCVKALMDVVQSLTDKTIDQQYEITQLKSEVKELESRLEGFIWSIEKEET